MTAPTVKIDPVAEAIEKALFGIELVITLDNGKTIASKMVMRAVKTARQAAIEYVVEKVRDNAGKFISDRSMEMFIEELKK